MENVYVCILHVADKSKTNPELFQIAPFLLRHQQALQRHHPPKFQKCLASSLPSGQPNRQEGSERGNGTIGLGRCTVFECSKKIITIESFTMNEWQTEREAWKKHDKHYNVFINANVLYQNSKTMLIIIMYVYETKIDIPLNLKI